jgi:SpoVK/Ycf46/Vps4 family AAA+-type ATPase
MYNDCIGQELTAQLLQEIDGMFSDEHAVFLVGATNRVDHIDSAILSRFSEVVQIPLPDENTRTAILEVFLKKTPFAGDKTSTIDKIAAKTNGLSGRDLRKIVGSAVLTAVKRTMRCGTVDDFALTQWDFEMSHP